jgi:hypothetical protein
VLNAAHCDAICSDGTIKSNVLSCTGLIVSPTGFEYFIATLTFTKVEVDDSAVSKAEAAAFSNQSVDLCIESHVQSFDHEDSITTQTLPTADNNMSACMGSHVYLFDHEDSNTTQLTLPKAENNMSETMSAAAAASSSLCDESKLFVKLVSLKVVNSCQ